MRTRGVVLDVTTYSIEDHLITAGTDTYQFDKDGFLTQKTTSSGITTYKYSSRGETQSVTLSDGTVISYDHDPMGRRITKRVNGNIVAKYLWSGKIRLMAVYDGNDNLIMRFNYVDGRMPVSMEYSGTTYYLLYDQVGSLRAVADNMGNIVKRVDYDSFGNIVNDTNPGFSVSFGFAGGLYDSDTGLIRFGVRDYDPAIGRWTAKDPIDFYGGDVNLYGYVGEGPVNFIDPWGLWTLGFGFGGTGGAGGAFSGSSMIVIDGHGNIAIVYSRGGGGMGGINISGGGILQITNSDNVNNLGGICTQTGGSFGEGLTGGVEHLGGSGYQGVNLNFGYGGGLTPLELHSVVENASVELLTNIFK